MPAKLRVNSSNKRRSRPGFFSRLLFGVVLPIGALLVAAAVWYRLRIQPFPLARYGPVTPALPGLRFWLPTGFALQLLLVIPTSIGLCFRLILRTRRQSRLSVFIKGMIAVALGTGMGLAMFQIFVWTLRTNAGS
jgi:hypothetical protein